MDKPIDELALDYAILSVEIFHAEPEEIRGEMQQWHRDLFDQIETRCGVTEALNVIGQARKTAKLMGLITD